MDISVALEFRKHVGPKVDHCGVTLAVDTSKPYSFRSECSWPPEAGKPDAWVSAIAEAVQQAVLQQVGSLDRVAVVLTAVRYDPICSSPVGYQRATRAALQAALSL